MPRFTTVLATAVATISLGFVAALPANADPTPVPTPPALTSTVQPMSLSGGTKVKVTINAGQAEFVRTASKLLRNGRNGTHLDWRKAKSYWGKHTSTRDQFASGWVKVGGKLDNASQSTIDRLLHYPSGIDAVRANPSSGERKPNCMGETKVTHPNSQTEDHYYDSCRTSDIIDFFDTCARWAGSVALLTPKWKPAAAVGVLLIAACNQGSGSISTARDKSDLNAIIWRTTTYKGYNGGYQTVAELFPQ